MNALAVQKPRVIANDLLLTRKPLQTIIIYINRSIVNMKASYQLKSHHETVTCHSKYNPRTSTKYCC